MSMHALALLREAPSPAVGGRLPAPAPVTDRPPRRRWRSAAAWLAVVVMLGLIGGAIAWQASGGRWVRVQTPSMGTVAPVGSLLWVRPVEFSDLRSGDLITFHPPGSSATYSHRVEVIHDDGTIGTKGVLSPSDPWRLGSDDVIGRVVLHWPGIGWLAQAMPMLLVGSMGIALIRRVLPGAWRAPSTLVLASLLVAIALSWYRPLVNADQLAFDRVSGGARATYVGTGLLPVQVLAEGGDAVVLRTGETGTVSVVDADRSAGEEGRLSVQLGPVIPWWWWVLMVGACFVPAAVDLVRRRPRRSA